MYDYIVDITRTKYDFFSKGPKGVIRKIIHFLNLGGKFFNLSFGDWNESLQKIDDRARTNNHDREKVFNTIAFAVLEFFERFPGARVIAKGSTAARTRLYQMAINSNWLEINAAVKIFGQHNRTWELMERQKDYEKFMVSEINIF